jgi:hypothetical protein
VEVEGVVHGVGVESSTGGLRGARGWLGLDLTPGGPAQPVGRGGRANSRSGWHLLRLAPKPASAYSGQPRIHAGFAFTMLRP